MAVDPTGSSGNNGGSPTVAGPTATITPDDTQRKIGDTTTVTFFFSEAVTGFGRKDMDLTNANGTLGDPTTDADGKTRQATFTPATNIADTTKTIRVDLGHIADRDLHATDGGTWSTTLTTPTTNSTLAGTSLTVNLTGLTDLAGNKGVGTQMPTNIHYAVDTECPVSAPEAPTDPTTPAAPIPLPLPLPTPVAPLEPAMFVTPDMDSDGLSNTVEDQVPGLPGPNGGAPMAGDGNGDGVEDSEQAAVGSTSVVLSPTGASDPADMPTSFVTLVDDSHDGKPAADPGDKAHITSLEQNDAPAHLPQGLEMPIGLMRLEATLATGSSETFSLYLDPALGVNGDWVQDDSGVWVNLASAAYGGQMVLEGGRLRLDFRITDGGPFDADGQANGAITVPAAPAQMPLSIVGQAPDTGHDGFWF